MPCYLGRGLSLPSRIMDERGHTVAVRPGLLGSVLLGGIAALLSWCLYGPASGWQLLGSAPADPSGWSLTLAGAAGAILVGIGGARWISSEVDKRVLRIGGANAAEATKDQALASLFATAPPSTVLRTLIGKDQQKARLEWWIVRVWDPSISHLVRRNG